MSRGRAAVLLAASLICVAALGLIGLSVESRLKPTSLRISGTPSARGQDLTGETFGESSPFVILLRGPAAVIDRQGPPLVAALRAGPPATVISPFSPAAPAAVRPTPGKALIVLDLHRPLGAAIEHEVPALNRLLATDIRPPLRATQTGFATFSRALQEESLDASERAELIAAPLVLLVLLLVFRSLVAAAIPLAFGAMTVLAARGALALLSPTIDIDSLSLVVCTMMGLALGVDYSLLVVSRFREELAAGRAPGAAALATRRSAGRTTTFAGATLFGSIFLSAFLQPGSLLVSLAISLLLVTAFSVAIAGIALPALLALIGERVNAGPIGRRPDRKRGSRSASFATAALRRPLPVALAIALPLVAIAVPAAAFNTAAPGIDELAASNPARRGAESIDRAVGPGWEAPFLLVAATTSGAPITSAARLALLSRWQRRIAGIPGVRVAIGPAALLRVGRRLRGLGQELDGPGLRRLASVGSRLRRAASLLARLQSGVGEAAAGSGLLAEGAGKARQGADLLAAGAARASKAAGRGQGGLTRLRSGNGLLHEGARRLAVTTLTLSLGLRSMVPGLQARLRHARRLATGLGGQAGESPGVGRAAAEARLLARELAATRSEARSLRSTALLLNRGLGKLAAGAGRLRHGAGRAAEGAGRLTEGLEQLAGGERSLREGLAALGSGAESLRQHLAEGGRRVAPLERKLRGAGTRLEAATAPLIREAKEERRRSPRLFSSPYLLLSALDGAPPVRRELAAEVVDLDRGGDAARILVVPDAPLDSAASRRLGSRLQAIAATIATKAGLRTGVTGGAATLNDYGAATKGRLPVVIGTIIAVTFLMLVVILRAPILAALAVGLNLLSVGAAIGVVSLVCKLPAGVPLGGHPYIDTVGAAAIFGVTFGLSIDYAVFLVARMREARERGADNREAIGFALGRTAAIITGAAAIMAAVFISFAASPVATISQMGIGLAVAIVLDATVVRLVLLPALMLLIGERVWSIPAWLDRLLPRVHFGAEGASDFAKAAR